MIIKITVLITIKIIVLIIIETKKAKGHPLQIMRTGEETLQEIMVIRIKKTKIRIDLKIAMIVKMYLKYLIRTK